MEVHIILLRGIITTDTTILTQEITPIATIDIIHTIHRQDITFTTATAMELIISTITTRIKRC